jgi:hypothetical protein
MEAVMGGLIRFSVISAALLILAAVSTPVASALDDHDPVVIVYKDGHRQTLATGEIARIDLKAPATILYKDGHREKLRGEVDRIEFSEAATAATPSRSHFIGKWEVGQGNGDNFFITLNADGTARKSIGSPHGTWTLVDGEAHIAWDDGWHDAIRKRGSMHEKVAYEPGKTFDDTPNNVTAARNTEHKEI